MKLIRNTSSNGTNKRRQMAAMQHCTHFKLNSLFGEMRKNGKLSTNQLTIQISNRMKECFELIQTTATKIAIAFKSNKSILGGGRQSLRYIQYRCCNCLEHKI